MNATILSLTKPLPSNPAQFSPTTHHRHLRSLLLGPIKSGSGGEGGNGDTTGGDGGNVSSTVRRRITPPDSVEIRFRRGSRRKSREQQQKEDDDAKGLSKEAQPSASKDWESMTVAEKATELYMGEKGLLFWLNKFSYASIFIIIGAWILFRFVGPALNLYQLDSPPLSPSSIFKGS